MEALRLFITLKLCEWRLSVYVYITIIYIYMYNINNMCHIADRTVPGPGRPHARPPPRSHARAGP